MSVGLGTNWVYVTDGSVNSTNIAINPASAAAFYRLTLYPQDTESFIRPV